jgi:hypothetical protein
VVREIVRESSGGRRRSRHLVADTHKKNYTEWAILMRVQLQGAGLWDAVDTDDATERQER